MILQRLHAYLLVLTTIGFGAAAAEDRLRIATVNYPLAYFAERIAGDRATVTFAAPADEDPAFWQPSVDALLAYHDADIIALNGAGYAKWLATAALPRGRLLDTGAAYADRLITLKGATHSHGPAGEHSHAGTAFTTWLDFDQAAAQARAIADRLARLRPGEAKLFEDRLQGLIADLKALDNRLRKVVGTAPPPLLASHPVYDYLARRYGLEIHAVLFEPDSHPDKEQWAELTALKDRHGARFMLWEDAPLDRTRRALEDQGIAVIVFQPLGNQPEDGDFLTAMNANIDRLGTALAP